MDAESYAKHCLRTWNFAQPLPMQKANCALGLAGEVAELVDCGTVDELGDVFYYLTVLRKLYGMRLGPLDRAKRADRERKSRDLTVKCGRICELVKKDVFHKDLQFDELDYVTFELWTDLLPDNVSVTEVRERNVEKLRKRFPEGFDVDNTGSDK